ncbi:MAG TPA: GNAT family N-acetyltransferase [Candidatus Udaeobacter sp.]|nr:GNAT family N-acetyltransferase [Candidatus Udaeobacter sp.]
MVHGVARLAASLRAGRKPRVSLRPARPVDYGFARQTCFSALREVLGPNADWDEALEDGLFARQFVQSEVEMVALGGQEAGWLQTRREGGRIHLIRFCLAAAFRSRGLGRFVLDRLQARARRAGSPIVLSLARIDPALEFYLRRGFRIVEVEPYRIHLRLDPRPSYRGPGPTPGMRRG